MARFDTINDMTPGRTYAGWRFFPQGPGQKVTGDYTSMQEAALAIQAYARSQGLTAQNVDFFIIQEDITYVPLTKTRFTITTATEPVVLR